jgi:hypothetical protein
MKCRVEEMIGQTRLDFGKTKIFVANWFYLVDLAVAFSRENRGQGS